MNDTGQVEKSRPSALEFLSEPGIHGPRLPTIRSWARQVFSFPAVLAALLMLTVFLIARGGFSDPDIWWHLRDAEYLLTHHSFLRADLYSYTAFGHPWINSEWLAEIPFYLAWRALGLVGIEALSLLLLASIYLGLLYLCWKKTGNIKASAGACYFAVFLGSVSFGPRTLLFGYDYLLALLLILERFRSRGRAPLWVIPPLFCLWINTHGSWCLGLIVFTIFVAAGMIQGQWGHIEAVRWSSAQRRDLWVTVGASIAGLFVNPYGYRLVQYPFDMAFRQKLNIDHVAEWVSVDFHDARGKIVLIFIATLLIGALMSRVRWQLYEVALVLFGIYCGLTYVRFLFLLAILAAPSLAKLISFIPPYQRGSDKPQLNGAILAVVASIVVMAFPSAAKLRKSVENEYPEEVIPYLEKNPPAGPVLNDYLWGGYLIWRDRAFKDFVDSRADVFVYTGVFKDYLHLLQLKDPPAILDKYGIRYVLFPAGSPLAYLLRRDPDWRLIFKGKVGVMFERAARQKDANTP